MILIIICSVDPAIITDGETGLSTEEKMITIDQEDGTDREIADMPTENDPLIDADEEVESEITVTGETILMIGHEGAARTLLTHGPVAEEKIPAANLQVGQNLQNQPRSVRVFVPVHIKSLMFLYRRQNPLAHLYRARPTRRRSVWRS